MLLKALTLENFKGIREPVRIEFAPLTLLFGPNNAGKSTIVQALMYAREVLERNECDVGRTMLGGDVLDLGGFRSLVHGQDTDQLIRMRFELSLGEGGLPEFWSLDERASALEDRFDERFSMRDDCEGLTDELRGTRFMLSRVRTALQEVWIELEIGYRPTSRTPMESRPIIRRYSVGTGGKAYAVISLPEESERAQITFYCGAPPFGWTYWKGEMDDFDWDMTRMARHCVLHRLRTEGWPDRGLKEGARVAFAARTISDDSNMMSRQDFDDLVAAIVAGEGIWGDAATDANTGETSWEYRFRQSLVESARSEAQARKDLDKAREDYQRWEAERAMRPATDEPDEELFCKDWDLAHYKVAVKLPETNSETMSPLADWLDQVAPQHERFDLTLSGSARPEWNELIQPSSDIWKEQETSWLASELDDHMKDEVRNFWSTIVIEPGRLVLRTLQASIYVGPFRKLPSRSYRSETRPEPQSWASGLGAWDLLAMGAENQLRNDVSEWLTSAHRFNTKYCVVAQRRKHLDIGGELWSNLVAGEIQTGSDALREKLEGLPEESKLELKDIDSGLVLAPQDLGVGISQVIPVIAAALHNSEGGKSGVVMIEEPESNIHPAFQVVLADLFITQAKANPNLLLLIETHSEHLMLRVMRRMRETFHGKQRGELAIGPSDVSVLFIEREDDRTCVRKMPLNEAGELVKAWPDGFFEEGLREQFGDD